MPTDPVSQFLDDLRRARLLDAAQVEKAASTLHADAASTQEELARRLVDSQLITRYQADQLLCGRGDQCLVAGRYRVEEKLGEGGMGTVYRALDTQLERPVALKVLAQTLTAPDAVARFRREAKALATVSHPNIIRALDAGEDQGRHFLVMELAEGDNLLRLVQGQGRIPPGLAADYARQAALGLHHAHEQGLVHRDVKPANLLLTRDGVVKLLDLGLARFLQDHVGDAGLTRDGDAMGTPDYTAPEQLRNARRADRRTDVYSLGCTLYHLLTGHVPFPGSSLSEKGQAHEERQPTPLAAACPEAPAGLALVVQRMLAKRPADRFQTAGETAEALLPYVAASSQSLPDLGTTATWQRGQLTMTGGAARRLLRRALGGAAVVALMALSALAVWLLDHKEHAPPTAPPDGAHVQPAGPKVVTIPNGLTVAQNGTGQYRTIGEALAKVRPGMTVHVLDDAAYAESLLLDVPERQAGVVLEAVNGATLLLPGDARRGLAIQGVPGVRVKGFRFRDAKATPREFSKDAFIAVFGPCPGLVLENLEIASDGNALGIVIAQAKLSASAAPIIVRGCTIKLGQPTADAVVLSGSARVGDPHGPTSRVCVRDNRISGGRLGVLLHGTVSDLQVTGNIIHNSQVSAVHVVELDPTSRGILIANNTLFDNASSLRVADNPPYLQFAPKEIEFANNLVFDAAFGDLVYLRGERGAQTHTATDGAPLLKIVWFHHNCRDLSGKTLCIPRAAEDRLFSTAYLVSRAPKDPDYLRPRPDSPLATGGAGGDLPRYVGAVPPDGAAPWDWDRTWKARAAKTAEKGER